MTYETWCEVMLGLSALAAMVIILVLPAMDTAALTLCGLALFGCGAVFMGALEELKP